MEIYKTYRKGNKIIKFTEDDVLSILYTIETNEPKAKYLEMNEWGREPQAKNKFYARMKEFEEKFNNDGSWEESRWSDWDE